jgi:hypothetical protein
MNCLKEIVEGNERKIRKYKQEEICNFLKSKNFYHITCINCEESSKYKYFKIANAQYALLVI